MGVVLSQSLLAGLATALGAVFVLLLGQPGRRVTALLLGLATGVMFLIVALELLPEALVSGKGRTAVGICVGIAVCKLSSLLLHSRTGKRYGRRTPYYRMGLMVALGIALHDLPEGLAIGAGFASSGELGTGLAVAIGLHNIPEGIGVAVPLIMAGVSKARILLLCLAISLVTPLGAILGLRMSLINPNLIGFLLAMAAGAMLFVLLDEIIPASHKLSRSGALLGFLAGASVVVLWLH